jgi:ubiquinone/menaquinone biosynthesis C-methylase UbiE
LRYDLIETKLPFKDDFFGAIFTCTVLQHIVIEEEIDNAISELVRVLKTDGHVMLFENVEPRLQPKNPLHVLFRTPEEYIEMFAENGVDLEEVACGSFHKQVHSVFVGQKL